MFLFGFGPGAAYRLPINLYVSGTLTLARLWFVDDYTNYPPPDTHWGIGGGLAVGKEWWVSRRGGVGIAARVNYASMKHHLVIRTSDKSYTTFDPWLHVATFSLLLSATYN